MVVRISSLQCRFGRLEGLAQSFHGCQESGREPALALLSTVSGQVLTWAEPQKACLMCGTAKAGDKLLVDEGLCVSHLQQDRIQSQSGTEVFSLCVQTSRV